MKELLSQPQVVGPAIGALIAIIGVSLAQFLENRRHKARLLHEAAEKARERKATTRRQIHLEVADDLALAVQYIASFGDLSKEPAKREEFIKRYGGAIGKLHLISEFEMLTKVIDFSEAFSKAVYELNLLRIAVEQTDVDLRQTENLHQQLATRFSDLINNLNSPAARENPSVSHSEFEALGSQLKEVKERGAKLLQKFTRDRIHLTETAFRKSNALLRLVAELVVYARKDLELPLEQNEQPYLNEVNASSDRALVELDKYVADVKRNTGIT